MEKRKVFKISIIDKEISRTEFDRNTFYTSDSELTLMFKMIEKNYGYDHGEILLYNEDDESFVTRPITKIDNDFVYELDLDIIPHYGTWQAQLQLVNDGDVYTSKPFEFNIVNDLSNLAPQPTLTDINNWATLKQSANELIDEMQDIIVSVEKAELERNNKENSRQKSESTRAIQESVRQQSEFKRDSQESVRQQNEFKRASQESVRLQSELKRVSQESVRQQSELKRVSQESVRQQAESSRVSAETQREIDHANRSAELGGKANKKQEDWITPTLLNGWYAIRPDEPPQYMKDEFGFVHFRGVISKGASATSNVAFQIPIGYRPNVNTTFGLPEIAVSPRSLAVTIFGNGNVDFAGALLNSWYAISSITFKVV